MRLRFPVCLVALSLPLSASTVKARDEGAAELNRVRVVYLVSGDRDEKAEYTAAIEHAIRDLQAWYAKQLGGPTFRLHAPIVEVAKSGRPAEWFYSNPNGANKDDWGYNNALDEARRLLGAKHNDPKFVWVIYSDGPGDKGRAGSGVACLPEDDLLGLVGKHPTQKDQPRWIAGLGHELGHAFGLPHPQDTQKDADALMWAGIYGKYPDNTYLTDDDKKILMRSPFFYNEDDSPVLDIGAVVARYAYRGGAFEQHAGKNLIVWTERKTGGDVRFTFEESARDDKSITLRDRSRGIVLRLPVSGGVSTISTDDGKTWSAFHALTREDISAAVED